MTVTKIYIIRHGETKLNVQGRLQGTARLVTEPSSKKFGRIILLMKDSSLCVDP